MLRCRCTTLSRPMCRGRIGRWLSAEAPKPPSPKRRWNDPGTLSIRLGWSLLALLLIDQGLQYQQKKARKEFLNDLQNYKDPTELAQVQEWIDREPLYSRIVRRVPDMDGYKSLRNVKVGDEVEVLEENAGPDNIYSVCRTKDENGDVSVGWFPTVDLEPPAKKARPWYKLW